MVEGAICFNCRKLLFPIHPPLCPHCGRPFAAGDSHPCSRCMERMPNYDFARAGGLYRNAMITAIHSLKYRERIHLAKDLAGWTLQQCEDYWFLPKADMLIPVPLHPRRLKERGFNQSLLIGRVLSEKLSIPCNPFILIRAIDTPPQVGLSEEKRRMNVRGAFEISRKKESLVAGKTLLLVDDVMTTGATVEECARTLKNSGAEKVYVLTIARVE